MSQKTVKIGPRILYLAVAVMLTPLAVWGYIEDGEFAIDIVVTASAAYLYWLGGRSLRVNEHGIQQVLYGIKLRTVPWDEVMDTLCYPSIENGRIADVNILIRLKGCRGAAPSFNIYEQSLYNIRHPLKSIYIDFDNYTSVIGQYTKLTYYYGPGYR